MVHLGFLSQHSEMKLRDVQGVERHAASVCCYFSVRLGVQCGVLRKSFVQPGCQYPDSVLRYWWRFACAFRPACLYLFMQELVLHF